MFVPIFPRLLDIVKELNFFFGLLLMTRKLEAAADEERIPVIREMDSGPWLNSNSGWNAANVLHWHVFIGTVLNMIVRFELAKKETELSDVEVSVQGLVRLDAQV